MTDELLQLFGLGLLGVIVALVLVLALMVRIQMRRYERFRGELTSVLEAFYGNIGDINQRLTAAGYPPTESTTVRSTYPAWAPPPRPMPLSR